MLSTCVTSSKAVCCRHYKYSWNYLDLKLSDLTCWRNSPTNDLISPPPPRILCSRVFLVFPVIWPSARFLTFSVDFLLQKDFRKSTESSGQTVVRVVIIIDFTLGRIAPIKDEMNNWTNVIKEIHLHWGSTQTNHITRKRSCWDELSISRCKKLKHNILY